MNKPNPTALNLFTQTANEYRNKLDGIRQQRNDMLDQIDQIRAASLPLVDAIARVEEFVTNNTLSGIPGLGRFFSPYFTSDKPLTVETIPDKNAVCYVVNDVLVGGRDAKVDLSGVLCSLFGDTIKKTLIDAVTQEAEFYEPGPPLAERNGLIYDLEAKVHALETEEEALICEATDAGIGGVHRRHDLNPEIVLMMEASNA